MAIHRYWFEISGSDRVDSYCGNSPPLRPNNQHYTGWPLYSAAQPPKTGPPRTPLPKHSDRTSLLSPSRSRKKNVRDSMRSLPENDRFVFFRTCSIENRNSPRSFFPLQSDKRLFE